MILQSLGELNEWAASRRVELVDAGVPLLHYEAGKRGAGYDNQAIRTVVDFIAGQIAMLPVKVYRAGADGSRERVRTGPVAELLRRPWVSPLPAVRLWYALLCDGLLTDRWLAVVEHVQGRMVLRRVPPRMWRPLANGADEVVGAVVRVPDGDDVELLAGRDDFLLDVGYATGGAAGTPRERTLQAVLDEFQASLNYRAQVNSRGVRSPFAILRDKPWPDADSRERFQRGMREFTGGGPAAGSGILLEDGMTTAKLDGFRPIDVADLDARVGVKLDVAAAYGVPPEVIGWREGNFSNLEAFHRQLFGLHLKPYLRPFELALNRLVDLIEPGRHLYIELDLDAQLRGAPEQQFSTLVRSTGRPVMTTNEARARLNLPRVADGDELVTPLNVLVGGQVTPGQRSDGKAAPLGGARMAPGAAPEGGAS